LELNSPIVLMCCFSLFAQLQHLGRRLHLGKQRAVALSTPTSVACAESVTATSS
jgi:hypothetical protein